MNNMKKLASILLALVMVFTMTTFAFAEGETGTLTIGNVVEDNTYKVYKVFNAVPGATGATASYTLVDGKTTAPTGFTVDEAGNVKYIGDSETSELTADDIAAIAEYVKDDEPVATVVAGSETEITIENLPYGYYYITTSTGSLVTIDSHIPNATIAEKNVAPELDKTITSVTGDVVDEDANGEGKEAIAQVGTDVEFKVEIEVGSGTSEYIFHDILSSGLTLKTDSLSVTVNGTPADYTETKFVNVEEDGEGNEDIILTFTEDYLKTVANETIVITYTATINDKALTTDSEKNSAWLEYGNDPGEGKPSTPKDETTVYDAKLTVTKKDGEGAALAGAGFVLQNNEGKYYKLVDGVVTWVAENENPDEKFSDAEGNVAPFTGLANGIYTLVEKTVPAGYNKAADKEITINADDVTDNNLNQTAEVVNKAGSILPSTGGIGTTIFYVSGAVLAIAAVVFLVTKKRMNGEEE